jgi:hypothetical protein
MAFLSLMLFQLKKQLLQWWILGYILCSLIIFFDIIPLNNIFFYLAIVISYIYLFFTASLYRKSDEIYLRFDWKTVFRNGFSHQFASVIILFIAIIFIGFVKVDNKTEKNWSLSNFAQIGINAWINFKPNSTLNQSFDNALNNFITKNPVLNGFQKQYSFLGLSTEKVISDNIKTMFKGGFDSKAKLGQILVEYFNKASQTIKTLVFSIFVWFILSIIGFFYFISKTVVYYLSYCIVSILIWTKFFKFEEKPTVKQYLTL